MHCFRVMIEGTLEWDPTSHSIPGCIMSESEKQSSAEDDDFVGLFTFHRCSCHKTSGPGVAQRLRETTQTRDEKTMSLGPGDWVVNDSNDSEEPLWVGRVMSNPDWDGKGVWRNDSTRTKTFSNGVKINPGQHGIYVMWYEKIDILSDDLDYHVSRTGTKPDVQHNEYMVLQGFNMHRVTGQSNPVPRPRNSSTSRRTQNPCQYQTSFEQWHDKEFGVTWKMDEEVRTEALVRCGMWR